MSEKKHELYLIALALVMAAGLVLYIAFDSPEMNAVAPPKNRNLQQTEIYETSAVSPDEPAVTTAVSETSTAAPTGQKPEITVPQVTGPVNINTATKEQLMMLDGIGEVKAQAILDYRRENGNFRTVEELLEVKGIGEKTLEKIRANVVV